MMHQRKSPGSRRDPFPVKKLSSVGQLFARTLLVAAVGLLAPEALGQTTTGSGNTNGTPDRECCPEASLLEGYAWAENLNLDIHITVDGQQVFEFAPARAQFGLQGFAALYAAELSVVNAVSTDVFFGGYSDNEGLDLPPYKGSVLATKISASTAGAECPPSPDYLNLGCDKYTITTSQGLMTVCICPPAQLSNPGNSNAGHTPFQFKAQLTNLPSRPLVFASASSSVDLWHHNPGEPIGEQYIELKHTDGTVVKFESISNHPHPDPDVVMWRIARVIDPFDNVAIWTYANHRLESIEYPSGIEERYSYGSNPPGWSTSGYGYSYVHVTYWDLLALGGPEQIVANTATEIPARTGASSSRTSARAGPTSRVGSPGSTLRRRPS